MRSIIFIVLTLNLVASEAGVPRQVQRELDSMNREIEAAFVVFSKSVDKARLQTLESLKKRQSRITDTTELLATVTLIKRLEEETAQTLLTDVMSGSGKSPLGQGRVMLDATNPAELSRFFQVNGASRIENGALRLTSGGSLASINGFPESFSVKIHSGALHDIAHPLDTGSIQVNGTTVWSGRWQTLRDANGGKKTEWLELGYNATTGAYALVNNSGVSLASGTIASPKAGGDVPRLSIQDSGYVPYGSNIRAIEIVSR